MRFTDLLARLFAALLIVFSLSAPARAELVSGIIVGLGFGAIDLLSTSAGYLIGVSIGTPLDAETRNKMLLEATTK